MLSELINKKFKTSEEVYQFFNSFPLRKNFIEQMEELNNVELYPNGIKSTSINAINFFTDQQLDTTNVKEIEKLGINRMWSVIAHPNPKKYVSFRIVITDFANVTNGYGVNSYKVKDNIKLDRRAYFYALGDNLMTDTFISTILELHKVPVVYNYLTFYSENFGYQLREFCSNGNRATSYTLDDYLTNENNKNINYSLIITQTLQIIRDAKNDENCFNHNDLTTNKFFLCDGKWKLGTFNNSSITYHGIRFGNTLSEKNTSSHKRYDENLYTVNDVNVTMPLPLSYDIYTYILSLLYYPGMYDVLIDALPLLFDDQTTFTSIMKETETIRNNKKKLPTFYMVRIYYGILTNFMNILKLC